MVADNPTDQSNISGGDVTAMHTYADLIINYLYTLGIRRIFGVPGAAIEPLFDALARHSRYHPDGIKLVITRHESGAAFMAAGYARETGSLGVCCSTTGPGATNLATGVASAYVERNPILVITPQTALRDFGRMPLQDSSDAGVDIVGMFSHLTRFNTLVSHPAQLEGKLIKAISKAFQAPQGPVHISIPKDILECECAHHQPSYEIERLIQPRAVIDDTSYEKLVEIVEKAKKIVVLAGGGCGGGAINPIAEFAEIVNSAVVTTPSGKSWMNAYHPLYRGVFGFAGHDSARQTLLDPEMDVLVAVGSRLDELSTSTWDKLALLNYKLVHIDSVEDNFSQSPMARLHVYGDVAMIFKKLTDDIKVAISAEVCREKSPPLTFATHGGLSFPMKRYHENKLTPDTLSLPWDQAAVKPQLLMQQLGKSLPQNARVVIDTGNAWSWAIHYLHLRSSGSFRIGIAFGAMTWAIGNAIGVASATTNGPVVAITGDGSMLMSGQEITVAVAERLSVVFVVLNDEAFGMVKHGQRLTGAEPIGYQLPRVDFAAVARAMGAEGFTIRNRQELDQFDFGRVLSTSVPTVLDVYIDPEEPPPMGVRVSALDRRRKRRGTTTSRRASDNVDATS
ncbi:hypothetical protein Tel_14310 [Candidatus Tenderia electrophaga]|uniref:Acetolactate synthase n=1 Tax=Candidatus Tenderia electrophaga TaxID=1748243 RepID=A0A0S2TGD8_9GAMM|nr:hypothetical protein Tel_14310 [Candidatus Tenderia electrophaga]